MWERRFSWLQLWSLIRCPFDWLQSTTENWWRTLSGVPVKVQSCDLGNCVWSWTLFLSDFLCTPCGTLYTAQLYSFMPLSHDILPEIQQTMNSSPLKCDHKINLLHFKLWMLSIVLQKIDEYLWLYSIMCLLSLYLCFVGHFEKLGIKIGEAL